MLRSSSHAFALAIATALWLPAPPAAARSCIRHAYEHMDLVRLAVRSGGLPVEPPPEFGDFDQLLNSGRGGLSLLFWDHDGDWRIAAKWFAECQGIEPTTRQREYFDLTKPPLRGRDRGGWSHRRRSRRPPDRTCPRQSQPLRLEVVSDPEDIARVLHGARALPPPPRPHPPGQVLLFAG